MGRWAKAIENAKVNLRLNAEVTAVSGKRGNFRVTLSNGEEFNSEFVIVAVGMQEIRLDIPGAELPFVQYRLDDPDEYVGERIVVIGAGDSGVENAVALVRDNEVLLINPGEDFPRVNGHNASLISRAINGGDIKHFTNSKINRLEIEYANSKILTGCLVLDSPYGDIKKIACDRVIVRIGTQPPRQFLQTCGIKFGNGDPCAYPDVAKFYETNVSGLFVIGSASGFPLIKQCLNQGYEIIEHIFGNETSTTDSAFFEAKFRSVGVATDEIVGRILKIAPYSSLSALQVRNLLIQAEIRCPETNGIVVNRDEGTEAYYSIVSGEIEIEAEPNSLRTTERKGAGDYFLGSSWGRWRAGATIRATQPSILLEVPRSAIRRLARSVPAARRMMEAATGINQASTPAVLNNRPNIEKHALRLSVFLPPKLCVDPIWEEGTNIVLLFVHREDVPIDAGHREWSGGPAGWNRYHASWDFIASLQSVLRQAPALQVEFSSPAVSVLSLLECYPGGAISFRPFNHPNMSKKIEAARRPNWPRFSRARPSHPASQSFPIFQMSDDTFVGIYSFIPEDRRIGAVVDVEIRLTTSGIIIGEKVVSFELDHDSPGNPVLESSKVYQKIFGSYSRRDVEIVKSFASILKSTGTGILSWDMEFLSAGDIWEERIERDIREADSFQLFWSKFAKNSENVEKEWRIALELKRAGFIKPVYWQTPIAVIPPELKPFHFAPIQLSSPRDSGIFNRVKRALFS